LIAPNPVATTDVSACVPDETGDPAGSYNERNVMKMRTLNRRQQLAVAASAVTAVGVAVVAPTQAAVARPSSTASAAVINHRLVITGTNGADNIQIALGADPQTLLVDLGQQTAELTFDRATFSSIAAFLGSGDDAFTVAARGDVTEPIFVAGGNGNDTISGGSGDDILVGGNGDDTILGGAGTDTIFGGRGHDTVDGGSGTDTEILGRGNDVAAWNPGEGNDVIYGGRGHDTLQFNGSDGNEKFDVSANGTRALLTRDIGNIRMDMDSVEALDLHALGGADQVTLHDLHQTDLTQAAIDLSQAGLGDDQQDTVVVEGTDGPDHVQVSADDAAVNVAGLAVRTQVTGSEGFDQLHVNTGAGNDSVQVDNAVAKLIGVTVDLGSNQIGVG
jgi:Ca2+-binding RTX toxin-like protein